MSNDNVYSLPIGSVGIERAKKNRPLWIRFKEWFIKQNAIEYERCLPKECKPESLAETMKGLKR